MYLYDLKTSRGLWYDPKGTGFSSELPDWLVAASTSTETTCSHRKITITLIVKMKWIKSLYANTTQLDFCRYPARKYLNILLVTFPAGGLSTFSPNLCSSLRSCSPSRACCWYLSFRASTSKPENISAGGLELVGVLAGLVEQLSLAGVKLSCSRLGLVNVLLDWRRECLRLPLAAAAAAGAGAGAGAVSDSWSSASGTSSLSRVSLSWVRSCREGWGRGKGVEGGGSWLWGSGGVEARTGGSKSRSDGIPLLRRAWASFSFWILRAYSDSSCCSRCFWAMSSAKWRSDPRGAPSTRCSLLGWEGRTESSFWAACVCTYKHKCKKKDNSKTEMTLPDKLKHQKTLQDYSDGSEITFVCLFLSLTLVITTIYLTYLY